MKIDISSPLYQQALPVLRTIELAGYEAYFVGGCVRDTLLGLPIHDIDIATSATPDEIESLFKFTFDVGKEHGTIIVLHDNIAYEVTTFRTEGDYGDFRRPDEVSFVRNLQEDTLRRDFTMNALAINANGELKDYHQGLTDLQHKRIRAVGIPTERFSEDALRMMRAIRFASQLGFDIESNTFEAIQTLSPLLSKISIERVQIELSKLLLGEYVDQFVSLLFTSQLIHYMPIDARYYAYRTSDEMTQLGIILQRLNHQNLNDETLAWAIWLDFLKIELSNVSPFLKTWKLSNQLIHDITQLIQMRQHYAQHDDFTDWALYQYDLENIQKFERWQKMLGHQNLTWSQRQQALPIKSKRDMQLNGKQLIQLLGLTKGGPIIGQIMDDIEQHIVTQQLANQYDAICDYIQQHYTH